MEGAGIRSLLFAPGHDEAKAVKAIASEADAVILDLEDAVPPDAKEYARRLVRGVLDNVDRRGKSIFVRINALDTGLAAGDLAGIVGGGPWGIVLPKCGGHKDLKKLSHYLEALEAREGIRSGSTRILAIVTEAAAATLNLARTARKRPSRLWGAMWGAEDLAASLGARSNKDDSGNYTFPYHYARSQCLFAAHTLGIAAIDAVWTDYRDLVGLECEARDGIRDGFSAKAAIHPAQAAVINAVMAPNPALSSVAPSVKYAMNASTQAATR